MSRPRLLDLYCGAGGAGVGYSRAGFEVVGVDINPQPNYPFQFIRADALEYAGQHAREFDVVHASPPCQKYSTLGKQQRGAEYVDLVAATRAVLLDSEGPYIIENVPGAPLIDPIVLCGTEFGLGTAERALKRHRLFESNIPLRRTQIGCQCKGKPIGGVYGTGGAGQMTRGYKFHPAEAREAMGIGWMSRKELSQAIPPAYTQWLGWQLRVALEVAA